MNVFWTSAATLALSASLFVAPMASANDSNDSTTNLGQSLANVSPCPDKAQGGQAISSDQARACLAEMADRGYVPPVILMTDPSTGYMLKPLREKNIATAPISSSKAIDVKAEVK